LRFSFRTESPNPSRGRTCGETAPVTDAESASVRRSDVTDADSVHGQRSYIRHVHECFGCGRNLWPEGEVWRIGGRPLLPYCRTCGVKILVDDPRSYAGFPLARPCVGCGRSVRIADFRSRPFYRCGFKVCAEEHRSREREQKHKASADRLFRCVQCGEMFKPTRSHARYCSGRCRQRACRRRARTT
jgi:hypothetical protein